MAVVELRHRKLERMDDNKEQCRGTAAHTQTLRGLQVKGKSFHVGYVGGHFPYIHAHLKLQQVRFIPASALVFRLLISSSHPSRPHGTTTHCILNDLCIDPLFFI